MQKVKITVVNIKTGSSVASSESFPLEPYSNLKSYGDSIMNRFEVDKRLQFMTEDGLYFIMSIEAMSRVTLLFSLV